jgi:hypothetical protein
MALQRMDPEFGFGCCLHRPCGDSLDEDDHPWHERHTPSSLSLFGHRVTPGAIGYTTMGTEDSDSLKYGLERLSAKITEQVFHAPVGSF